LATVTPSLVMVGDPNFFSHDNVAALGAEGDFYRVGEKVNAAQDCLARLFSMYDFALP